MLCLKPVCAKVCEYCQFSIYYSDEETRNLFFLFFFCLLKSDLFLCVFSTCMSVWHMHAVPMDARKYLRSSGTRLMGDCEPPCGCWLGTEPRSSGRTSSVLNHWAISLASPTTFPSWRLAGQNLGQATKHGESEYRGYVNNEELT